MQKSEKFCVFCGQHPEGKSREHVIPRWLIELTGDLNRKAFFGFDITKEPLKSQRSYSFDSFVFPACAECNDKFSHLESQAKQILTTILENAALNSLDWHIFLDWLDKIRIGLWLGFFYLDKNIANIKPKFHIKRRVGLTDRFVIIYRTDTHRKAVAFFDTQSISFSQMPSCFLLRVNNYYFLNASIFGLVARRLGYPFPASFISIPDGTGAEYEVVEGFARPRYPVVRKNFVPNGVFLCQAIFKEQMLNPESPKLYDTEYVRSHSIDWKTGIGSIFQEVGGKVCIYPKTKSKQWVPSQETELHKLEKALFYKTLDYQTDLFAESVNPVNFSDMDKKLFRRDLTLMRLYDKRMKSLIDRKYRRNSSNK